ncbi:hypothetical protein H0H81_012457 [Sphagnurus paluster]|uniref:3-hydroxyisobutyrate dehydrogenase n=1 Tax=Sphagnurus paluster TaxID=117069 RepID=A0A9P7KJ37_9AGAR|nr:hypothetical protein H0H81_012457 [Sphagnurus paluster]
MRPSLRSLKELERICNRHKSTSFIGLGRMGHEMAYNLFSKQFARDTDAHFVVCDAIADSAHAFSDKFLGQFPSAKIAIASTPEEAILASQIVVTMLPSSPQVQSVYSEGFLPVLRKLNPEHARNTLCIDSTTLDVTVARNVAADVISTGAEMVDAPVSGGVQQIVIGEAMLLGQRLGLDPVVLAGVINSSTGGCWASSVNNPVPSSLPGKSPPCERDYEGGFATALMLKDMGLAREVAEKTKTAIPLGEAAEEIYRQVIAERPELSRKDFSSVYKFLEMS